MASISEKAEQNSMNSDSEGEESGTGSLWEDADFNPFLDQNTDSEGEESVRTETLEETKKNAQAKLGKRQGITIASWNVRGKKYANGSSKWKEITRVIRKNRIAVLAVQETRMTDEEALKLENENPRLRILNNGKNSNKEGVLFAINLDMISLDLNETRISHKILIKNRASQLRMTWAEDQEINIINVYVPNASKEKADFLEKLGKKLKNEYTKGMCMMGDFNCVEEAVDRAPMHEDENTVRTALRNMKKKLKLVDGWRIQNPEGREYTFLQEGTGSMARIDRAYVKKDLYNLAYDWTIESNFEISDHNLITVKLLKDKLPFCGKGMWRLQKEIIDHEPFRKRAEKELKTFIEWNREYFKKEIQCGDDERKLKKLRNKGNNPQMKWELVKTKIAKAAKEETIKIRKGKEKQKRNATRDLESQIQKMNSKTLKESVRKKAHDEALILRGELDRMEREKLDRAKESARARYLSEGETSSKYWFALNKKKAPQNVVYGLQDKNGNIRTETKEMLKIASEYHKELQARPEMTEQKRKATEKIKKLIDTELTEKETRTLEKQTSAGEIQSAIKSSKNGKCPGHSGITYEFWKSWPEPKKDDSDGISISSVLGTVYNDIEKHGLECEGYTKGIMYLLYKKKDKTRIENYRPITLLETDYKLHTKTVANRLGKVCKNLINEDQAGFVPGRSLYDHTRLAGLMPQYAESEFKDGCIVSLDQEKAYDKIDHDYLWTILDAYGFPTHFINLIKTLYSKAKTEVMVNGAVNIAIAIWRGVRQGDPMSCLLYNLAIEPLACALRKSKKLKGFQIPDYRKLVVKLFADDTLVYLNKNDKYENLEKIIKLFCDASTAKFNMEKTEVLPIGSKEHRKQMMETRSMGGEETSQIPDHVNIVKDKQAMRTLGAWVGNEVKTTEQWSKIIEKQNQVLELWGRSRPTLKGKELILKALVTSRSWFLATVNEMPESVEKELNKNMKDFLWDGKKIGLMELAATTETREHGGLGVPNIKARLEAIHVMWLKKYLARPEERPAWCWIADVLIKKDVTKGTEKETGLDIRTSWVMQNWRVAQHKHSKLPNCLRDMLKVGEKYGVHPYARKADQSIKRNMPIWKHRMYKGKNTNWTWKKTNCLKDVHEVSTVGQLQDFAKETKRKKPNECRNQTQCRRIAKAILDELPRRWNPNENTPYKDDLDFTPVRLSRRGKVGKDPVTYNPDVTERTAKEDTIRIFLDEITEEETNLEPAYRKKLQETGTKWIAYTDGSCLNGNTSKATSGAGIYFENRPELSMSFRVPGKTQTNQRAELAAIIKTLEVVPDGDQLEIRSDSKYALQGIIENSEEWEDKGWIGVENPDLFQKILHQMNERGETTELTWVKGHSGTRGNEEADRRAGEGAAKPEVDELNTDVPKHFKLPGARLNKMTQKTAYEHILKKQNLKPIKKKATANMKETLEALEDSGSQRPSGTKLWKDMKCKAIRRNIQDFLWKMMHGNLRAGAYWKNIPGYEDRAICKICEQSETMDHVFFQCEKEGREELWRYAEKLWDESNDTKAEWVNPTAALVRGLGSVQIKRNGKTSKVLTKKYKTIVSETAWIIWRLRNERLIGEKVTTKAMYKARWINEVNETIRTQFVQALKSKKANRKIRLDGFKREWLAKETIAVIAKGNLVLKRWDKTVCA